MHFHLKIYWNFTGVHHFILAFIIFLYTRSIQVYSILYHIVHRMDWEYAIERFQYIFSTFRLSIFLEYNQQTNFNALYYLAEMLSEQEININRIANNIIRTWAPDCIGICGMNPNNKCTTLFTINHHSGTNCMLSYDESYQHQKHRQCCELKIVSQDFEFT